MLSVLSSDSVLVRRALVGNSDAVERLVLRYQARAQAIARAMVAGSLIDPDDVVQESFLQALRDLRTLRDPEAFGRWLVAIVRNVARARLAKHEPVSRASLPDMPAAVQDGLELEELRSRLWCEVAALPQGVREAIFLYYYDGESVRVVADALEISRAAAKKRLQKDRDLLRVSL